MANDFDLDLPIDGKFVEPRRPKRRRSAAVSHVLRRKGVNVEALRPRISIETATSSVKKANIYRRLAISFLGATVVVVGIIAFFTLQKATVIVTQQGIPVSASTVITVTKNVSSTTGFAGQIAVITTSTEKVFTPATTVDKPGKARGVITVSNTGSRPQPLVATTRFLNPEGVLFRSAQSVTVPAAGTIDVTVVADQAGPESDIGPSKFIIPGLNAAQQKIVFGESARPMMGGNGKIGKITQADIDRAGEETRKVWMQQEEQALSQIVLPPDFAPLYTTVYMKLENSAKLGEEVGQFSVRVSGAMALVAYPKKELLTMVDNQLQSKAPTPYHKILFTSTEPVIAIQSLAPNHESAELQVQRDGQAVLDGRSAAFQPTQFLGRTAAEIKQQLSSIQGVLDVRVKFMPFWLNTAPSVPSRIAVEITEAE